MKEVDVDEAFLVLKVFGDLDEVAEGFGVFALDVAHPEEYGVTGRGAGTTAVVRHLTETFLDFDVEWFPDVRRSSQNLSGEAAANGVWICTAVGIKLFTGGLVVTGEVQDLLFLVVVTVDGDVKDGGLLVGLPFSGGFVQSPERSGFLYALLDDFGGFLGDAVLVAVEVFAT